MSKKGRVKVRLLFVDEGSYHHEEVDIPAASLDGYERIIDCIREDEAVQKRLFVDVHRLCSAAVVEE
ncbi:MAG: hypothetical protein AMXMBFR53_18640 [Gemmatimonadota bacterium]